MVIVGISRVSFIRDLGYGETYQFMDNVECGASRLVVDSIRDGPWIANFLWCRVVRLPPSRILCKFKLHRKVR